MPEKLKRRGSTAPFQHPVRSQAIAIALDPTAGVVTTASETKLEDRPAAPCPRASKDAAVRNNRVRHASMSDLPQLTRRGDVHGEAIVHVERRLIKGPGREYPQHPHGNRV